MCPIALVKQLSAIACSSSRLGGTSKLGDTSNLGDSLNFGKAGGSSSVHGGLQIIDP